MAAVDMILTSVKVVCGKPHVGAVQGTQSVEAPGDWIGEPIGKEWCV
jgi:hypothetical protein